VQRAIHYLQQVGEQAARRNAHHEALAACTRGLTLLATLSDSSERARHELTLQLSRGALLMAARGIAAPEAGEAYTRAYALCQQVGEPLQRCQALWGLAQVHGALGQLGIAGEMSQRLLHLAQRQSDPTLVLEAHVVLGALAFYGGDLVTARAHLEQSLPLCTNWQSPGHTFYGGYEPRILHGTWFAWVLWTLGYADQARQRCQELLALAQQAGHLPSLALAEFTATMLAQYCRDAAATQACAEALMALAARNGFLLRVEQGRVLRGWALAMQGDAATGVAYLRQGLAATQDTGPKLLRSYFLALLAEAYGQAGQPEAGLTVLDEALTLMATTEERWWAAEMYRLQGELLQKAEDGRSQSPCATAWAQRSFPPPTQSRRVQN
jgi:predicted ATPase